MEEPYRERLYKVYHGLQYDLDITDYEKDDLEKGIRLYNSQLDSLIGVDSELVYRAILEFIFIQTNTNDNSFFIVDSL